MSPREQFDRELKTLRDDVIKMGLQVGSQLDLALQALDSLDTTLAKQVKELDLQVNAARFSIEDACFKLIVTQQPAARDLRAIFAAINIIVDLERVGDKAKDIADTIPQVTKVPKHLRPELTQMGKMVRKMIGDCIQAYGENNVELARQVSGQAEELDKLFAKVIEQALDEFAKATKEKGLSDLWGFTCGAAHGASWRSGYQCCRAYYLYRDRQFAGNENPSARLSRLNDLGGFYPPDHCSSFLCAPP